MKCRRPRLVLSQLSLRAGLEIEVGKWVRNVAFATHGWDEAAEEGPRGEGGGAKGCGLKLLVYVAEKLKDKRQKEIKHKQKRFQGKGQRETVDKRKRPLS